MPLTGFFIAAIGGIIAFISFALTVLNMGAGVKSGFDAFRSADHDSLFGKLAKVGARLGGGHLLGMVGMAFGGFVAAGGLLLAIVQAIQTYAPVSG